MLGRGIIISVTIPCFLISLFCSTFCCIFLNLLLFSLLIYFRGRQNKNFEEVNFFSIFVITSVNLVGDPYRK